MLNIYRASAGSGKTFRLTQDYIHLLFSLYPGEKVHRRILAVTFTNKATDEMKHRILAELFALSSGAPSDFRQGLMLAYHLDEKQINERSKKLLIHILHDYSAFSISTIDTFFQQVLRSFAREIGINGSYNLELDSEEMLENAIDTLFQDLSKTENSRLLQWLTTFAEEKVEQSENWNIRTNISNLGKEIFKENYQYKAEETNKKLHDKIFLAAYISKIKKIKRDFEKNVEIESQKALNILNRYELNPEDFSRAVMHKTLENLKTGSFDVSATFQKYAQESSCCYANNKPQHIKDTIDTAYANGLGDTLKNIMTLLSADAIHYNTADLILKHLNTLGVLSDLAMYIKQLSTEQNTMLISDTNMLLNRIIEESDTPFVYEKTGINVDHFMIDEFQDTSFLQWKNFKPLIKESVDNGKINLIVGDVKQSIYRWRNSDWKLLQEEVESDFEKEQVNIETLQVNWRSDKNIVEFNNSFFKDASKLLQLKLNEDIESMFPVYPELESMTYKIATAYQDVHQQTSCRAAEGHVKVEFLKQDEDGESWKQAALKRIPNQVESLIDRGYKLSDIALLVRKNKEAIELINYLLQYKNTADARKDISYNVIGNEGILMSASSSIKFIIALLNIIRNPRDKIQQTIMNYEYSRGKLKKTEQESINYNTEDSIFSRQKVSLLFTDEENALLQNLNYTSLYELTESIIDIFRLNEWYGETVFLQSFQDTVFKFVSNRNADINSFLIWWNRKGIHQTIATPENQDALRVMTVHKSKGLDFKVVIIPFCEWELTAAKNKSLMWLETNEAPFDELSLIPINFSSKLGASVFAKQYYEELLYQYVDNLNIAYVAFTRARNELICFTPYRKTSDVKSKKTELEKIQTLSDLLQKFVLLKRMNEEQQEEEIRNNNLLFKLGKDTIAQVPTRKKEEKSVLLRNYPIFYTEGRLKIKSPHQDTWKDNINFSESLLNFGTIMHNFLQKLSKPEDEDNLILELIHSGKITHRESDTIRQTMQRFWKLPHIDQWFFTKGKIWNETTILLPTGKSYRPDRVVIVGKKAIVSEYKFGNKKREAYRHQICQYGNVLRQMEYSPEMFLIYVEIGEVEII